MFALSDIWNEKKRSTWQIKIANLPELNSKDCIKVQRKKKKKNALYLSVKVFSTKVLTGETERSQPSHAKV